MTSVGAMSLGVLVLGAILVQLAIGPVAALWVARRAKEAGLEPVLWGAFVLFCPFLALPLYFRAERRAREG